MSMIPHANILPKKVFVIVTSRAAAESNNAVGGRCSSADVCLIGFIGVKVSPVGVVLQQTFVS